MKQTVLRAALGALAVWMVPVVAPTMSLALPSAGHQAVMPGMPSTPVRRYRTRGVIEIEFNGARLVVKGAVDAEALRVVLSARPLVGTISTQGNREQPLSLMA